MWPAEGPGGRSARGAARAGYLKCDDPSCDSTEHRTPEDDGGPGEDPSDDPSLDPDPGEGPDSGAELPDAGGPSAWYLLIGVLILAVGGAATWLGRRRG